MKNATRITAPVSPNAIVRTHPMWVNTQASNVQKPVQVQLTVADILSEKESFVSDRATD